MGPLIRILARVFAGFLIGRGFTTTEASEAVFSDPAFDMAVGFLMWAATEGFYVLARRWGWRT